MTLYDRLADLPLVVSDTSRSRRERATSSGFTRATTVFALLGDGETGRGEDVTYDAEDHDALADAPPFDFTGEYTLSEFSAMLDDIDLFPTKPPERETGDHYRRWAVESAALDLALKQAGTTLGEALDREYDPVRFVVSTRLDGEAGPSSRRVDELLAAYPDSEFKLDPTSDWGDELVSDLAETDAVRILDLKGYYSGTTVDQGADPDLYERVFSGFPDAVVEDPAVTGETEAMLERETGRLSWDAPITGVESVESLPFEPRWLNVKPSRFGTLESLLETIEYAEERDISLYGGGQFELDVGRPQIQQLASLFYPDGPNDVAPGEYNDPEVPAAAPTSPLDGVEPARGFGTVEEP
ncbi:hypothetical protein [Haloprofundus sp. MHR1]|uniref:hypothetical protein n=1 Tax=Haloprofundus sp. MHR1 TaxID=2572921 RepID=UPI0010BEC21D|nr:hypothetical protein [Haloprofundus sp. MHR1]QCJ46243.1 hypothetical protein FCF25_03520 [Haloprofundus sp. MHR1]